jgi:hypothetical protein
MRRADQLFGVGAGGFFKTRGAGELALIGAGGQAHAAFAFGQAAVPDGGGFTNWHNDTP